MHLTRLTLRQFRNFTNADLLPGDRFNVVAGPNGAGKTNLLEAIYWLATLRPIRATRLQELHQWGGSEATVDATVQHLGLTHRFSVRATDGRRVARREGKTARARDYFGVLAVVLFTPDDVGMIRGQRSERRRWLDRAIFTSRAGHLATVLGYRRALDMRNAGLRSGADDPLMDAYELTLAGHGARLTRRRMRYVSEFAPVFDETFRTISGEGLKAEVIYRGGAECDIGEGSDAELAFAESLQRDRERDRERGFTQRGPHADDLQLRLLGRSAKAFASQGQQRAMVLALKIAEIQLLETQLKTRPVLLLDDVSSELDALRNERLFDFLNLFEGQVFITTTDAQFLNIKSQPSTFGVHAGQVEVIQ